MSGGGGGGGCGDALHLRNYLIEHLTTYKALSILDLT